MKTWTTSKEHDDEAAEDPERNLPRERTSVAEKDGKKSISLQGDYFKIKRTRDITGKNLCEFCV